MRMSLSHFSRFTTFSPFSADVQLPFPPLLVRRNPSHALADDEGVDAVRALEVAAWSTHPLSLAVEEWSKFRARDKAGRLTENGSAGPGAKFGVVRDGQRLPLAAGADAAQLDMTSPCELASNPHLRRMATTSWPESRLSRGRVRLQFEGDENTGRGRQSQLCQIFSLQMQLHSLAQIARDFVESSALRHDGDLQTLGDIARLFSVTNSGFNRAL